MANNNDTNTISDTNTSERYLYSFCRTLVIPTEHTSNANAAKKGMVLPVLITNAYAMAATRESAKNLDMYGTKDFCIGKDANENLMVFFLNMFVDLAYEKTLRISYI